MEESTLSLSVDSKQTLESSTLSSDNISDNITTLKVGEAVQLDELGPIIINTDGTTTKISNWSNMTQQERDTAIRLIAARNKKRVEILKEKRDKNDNS